MGFTGKETRGSKILSLIGVFLVEMIISPHPNKHHPRKLILFLSVCSEQVVANQNTWKALLCMAGLEINKKIKS